MFNGLDKYKLNGRDVVASRETAKETNFSGTVMGGREVAMARRTEVANSGGGGTSTSSMVLGGITHEDLSLNYVGGTSQQGGGQGGGGQSQVPQEVYKYYDAIYREDSICGAAIELRANIPYGDFTIHGVDKVKLSKYEEALDNMRLRTMMPRIAIERDVQGAFLGLLDWNAGKKTYDSMLPYSRQHVKSIMYPGIHGMDPMVDIELNVFLADILASTDERLTSIKANIPKFLLNAGKGNKGVPVPMDSIVYIDRPHTDPRFNSMLHRILPVFLIERALTRGTIEAAHRRQRGILHVTAGSGDQWLASPEEMTSIAQLFNNADADPLGAIVVTREGISPNEVRNPTDFWRITDSFEQTVPFKLRALGVSESFLSGDATFNNAEVAISTFLQTVKMERMQVTEQLFYRKIFLQIAEANNFRLAGAGRERGSFGDNYQKRSMEVAHEVAHLVAQGKKERARAVAESWQREQASNAANSLQNIALYDTPKLTWKQSLMPEGDSAYIDLLNNLYDHNVPAPIRTMFAAGGLDFDAIMSNQKQDLDDREKLAEYLEGIHAAMPAPPVDPNMMGGAGGGDEFAMFSGTTKPMGLLSRDYTADPQYEYAEPYTEDNNGKRRRPMTRTGKLALRDKQHKELAHALSRIAETHNRKVRAGVE